MADQLITQGAKVVGDGTSVDITANVVSVKDDGIDSAKIDDGTIENGDIKSGEITSAKLAFGTAELISRTTILGSHAQTVTFTSLDLEAGHEYEVRMYVKNSDGSTASYSIYFNADTTATNYYTQGIDANGAGLSSARGNNAIYVQVNAGENMVGSLRIRKVAGEETYAMGLIGRKPPSAVIFVNRLTGWTSTANVTGITLSSSVASGFGIGSVIELWKITG